jgi:hypothetical protein
MAVPDNDTSKKFSEQLLEYVSKNPFLTLWSFAAIIGGLFGFFHYARVGYMPEIDIKTAGTILISLALTGGIFTILVAAIFLVPAFYLRSVVGVEQVFGALDISEDPVKQEIKKQRRRVVRIILSAAILALGLYSLLIGCLSGMTTAGLIFGAIGGVLVAVTTFFCKKIASLVSPSEKRQITNVRVKAFVQFSSVHSELIGAVIIWFFAFSLVFIMIGPSVLSSNNATFTEKTFWFLGLLFVVIVSNLTLSIPGLGKDKRYASLLLVMFVFAPMIYFLTMPNNELNLEKVAFNKLGLGSLKDSFFLVNSDTCDAVNVIRENTCIQITRKKSDHETKDESKSIGCIRPQYLENRLGSEYLMAFENKPPKTSNVKEKNANGIMIPIQKKDVILWAFGEETRSSSTQCVISKVANEKP